MLPSGASSATPPCETDVIVTRSASMVPGISLAALNACGSALAGGSLPMECRAATLKQAVVLRVLDGASTTGERRNMSD